jgi:hypothetical protein
MEKLFKKLPAVWDGNSSSAAAAAAAAAPGAAVVFRWQMPGLTAPSTPAQKHVLVLLLLLLLPQSSAAAAVTLPLGGFSCWLPSSMTKA